MSAPIAEKNENENIFLLDMSTFPLLRRDAITPHKIYEHDAKVKLFCSAMAIFGCQFFRGVYILSLFNSKYKLIFLNIGNLS